MDIDVQKTAKIFKALCDPKRLRILDLLRSGEKCACVLQDRLQELEVTQSGLSYHMKILCESGIVQSRQDGKWTHYRLSEQGRDRAMEVLWQITTPDSGQVRNICCEAPGGAPAPELPEHPERKEAI